MEERAERKAERDAILLPLKMEEEAKAKECRL
jgi:hypothetical protein